MESSSVPSIVNEKKSRKYLWDSMYKLVVNFKEVNGHCNVPRYYSPHPKLGAWVQTQRTQYRLANEGKHNNMYPERIEKLNALGFDWSPRGRHEIAWDGRIKQLKQFKEQHGTCAVPRDYGENQQLAHWVANQRRQYILFQEGKTTSLNEGRIQALNELGFVWKTNGTRGRKPKVKCQDAIQALRALRNSFQPTHPFIQQSHTMPYMPQIMPQEIPQQAYSIYSTCATIEAIPDDEFSEKCLPGTNGPGTSLDKKKNKWLCDFCKKKMFDNFEDACEHEKNCPERYALAVGSLLKLDQFSVKK